MSDSAAVTPAAAKSWSWVRCFISGGRWREGTTPLTPRFRRLEGNSQVGPGPHVRSEFRGLHRFRRRAASRSTIVGAFALFKLPPNLPIPRLGERPYADSAAPRDPSAARALLRRGAATGRDAQHAHRLEAEAELLATVGGADVQAGELADALEAVADGVAGGGETPGGGRGGCRRPQGTPPRGGPGRLLPPPA